MNSVKRYACYSNFNPKKMMYLQKNNPLKKRRYKNRKENIPEKLLFSDYYTLPEAAFTLLHCTKAFTAKTAFPVRFAPVKKKRQATPKMQLHMHFSFQWGGCVFGAFFTAPNIHKKWSIKVFFFKETDQYEKLHRIFIVTHFSSAFGKTGRLSKARHSLVTAFE